MYTDPPTTPAQPDRPEQPERPELPEGPRYGIVHVFAFATLVIGIALIVRTLVAGGGIGSYGVLMGAFFVAAGLMRLRLLNARRR